jgi:hypothetical protein
MYLKFLQWKKNSSQNANLSSRSLSKIKEVWEDRVKCHVHLKEIVHLKK